MKKRDLLFILIPICLVSLVGCNEEICPDSYIMVDVDTTYLLVGDKVQLDINVIGCDEDDEIAIYESDESSKVLSVDENYEVTALEAGQAKVRVYLVANEEIYSDVYFDVYQSIEDVDPNIDKMITYLNTLDFDQGIRGEGNITIDLGSYDLITSSIDIKPTIPFTADVTFGNQSYFTHLAFNFDDISITSIDYIDELLLPVFKASLLALITGSDDTTLIESANNADTLDLYFTGDEYIYVGIESINDSGDLETLTFNRFNLDDSLESEGISISLVNEWLKNLSSLEPIEIARAYSTASAFIDLTSEDTNLRIQLNDYGLSLVSGYFENLFDTVDEELGAFARNLTIPESITDVSVYINNDNETDEYEFRNVTIEVETLSNEEIYTFLSVSLDRPTQLDEEAIPSIKEKLQNLIEEYL